MSSVHKGAEAGKFVLTAGKFYGDAEQSKGIQTSQVQILLNIHLIIFVACVSKFCISHFMNQLVYLDSVSHLFSGEDPIPNLKILKYQTSVGLFSNGRDLKF